jgi:hypothetical protein
MQGAEARVVLIHVSRDTLARRLVVFEHAADVADAEGAVKHDRLLRGVADRAADGLGNLDEAPSVASLMAKSELLLIFGPKMRAFFRHFINLLTSFRMFSALPKLVYYYDDYYVKQKMLYDYDDD